MKSYNHLYEKFISDLSIIESIESASLGKKDNQKLKSMYSYPPIYLDKLRNYGNNFKNAKHTPHIINDGISRKKRVIIVPTPYEQVIHHMVVRTLAPIFMKSMYEHSYGSIPGRGGHKGMKFLRSWLNKDPEGTKYCLKMDIRKFFDSVPHDIVIQKLEALIHDDKFMRIMRELISVNDKGLPLGFYTSQWLANWYLTPLDHFIKEDLGAKYYMRYMDDMIILSSNKEELFRIREEILKFLCELGLDMKSNWQVFPVDSRSIDFMGFRFFHGRVILRKSILYNACRRANRIYKKCGDKPTIYSIRQILSYLGWFSYTDTYNIFKKRFVSKINVQKCKRRLSNYDKRMASLSGGLQAG